MKCCDLSAGMLREPLTFQRKQGTPDGMGGQIVTWQTLFTTRGHVAPLSGREALHAMQLQDTVSHRIYIRYREDLRAADRVLLRGQPLQVRAVLNLEMRNRWLELPCESGVPT